MNEYPGSLYHRTPGWVLDGFKFHIRIRAESGQNLVEPETARALLKTAEFYRDNKHWWYSLFLLMPDHLHGIIIFRLNSRMSRIVSGWKSHTARYHGIKWQPNYFDCRMRTGQDADETWHYIRQNPVRAKLCKHPDDWPWLSTNSGRAENFDWDKPAPPP